jgi:hypothetical protein
VGRIFSGLRGEQLHILDGKQNRFYDSRRGLCYACYNGPTFPERCFLQRGGVLYSARPTGSICLLQYRPSPPCGAIREDRGGHCGLLGPRGRRTGISCAKSTCSGWAAAFDQALYHSSAQGAGG